MYKTRHLIRARKLDRRCVKGCQASRVGLRHQELIKISCYTEYQSLRLSLLYNNVKPLVIGVVNLDQVVMPPWHKGITWHIWLSALRQLAKRFSTSTPFSLLSNVSFLYFWFEFKQCQFMSEMGGATRKDWQRLEQGSQTQNYTRAALRRNMSQRAAD